MEGSKKLDEAINTPVGIGATPSLTFSNFSNNLEFTREVQLNMKIRNNKKQFNSFLLLVSVGIVLLILSNFILEFVLNDIIWYAFFICSILTAIFVYLDIIIIQKTNRKKIGRTPDPLFYNPILWIFLLIIIYPISFWYYYYLRIGSRPEMENSEPTKKK